MHTHIYMHACMYIHMHTHTHTHTHSYIENCGDPFMCKNLAIITRTVKEAKAAVLTRNRLVIFGSFFGLLNSTITVSKPEFKSI